MSATAALLDLLKRHYIKPGTDMPGGIFLPECGVNGEIGSRVDALYVGFTSASGRLLVGHELKVSRSDWRRELDKVGKADFWADNCHQWWIVAPGPEVVPKDELPHGWGLLYPGARGSRMQVVVKAETHAQRTPSWQAVRSVLARVDTLRAGHDHRVRTEAFETARKRAAEEYANRNVAALTAEQQTRLNILDRLEHMLGRRIDSWVLDEDGEAVSTEVVAAALRLTIETKKLGLDSERFSLQRLTKQVEQAAAGLEAFTEARDVLLTLTANSARAGR